MVWDTHCMNKLTLLSHGLTAQTTPSQRQTSAHTGVSKHCRCMLAVPRHPLHNHGCSCLLCSWHWHSVGAIWASDLCWCRDRLAKQTKTIWPLYLSGLAGVWTTIAVLMMLKTGVPSHLSPCWKPLQLCMARQGLPQQSPVPLRCAACDSNPLTTDKTKPHISKCTGVTHSRGCITCK